MPQHSIKKLYIVKLNNYTIVQQKKKGEEKVPLDKEVEVAKLDKILSLVREPDNKDKN